MVNQRDFRSSFREGVRTPFGVLRVASQKGRTSEVPPRDAIHSIILSKVSQAQKIKLYISPLPYGKMSIYRLR